MAEEIDVEDPTGLETDDTPDEIRDFLIQNNIGTRFQAILKERHPSGPAGTLATFNNECPSIPDIGEQWGPGKYSICFSFKERDPSGKKKPTMKEYEINLPERAWRDKHEAFLAARSKAKKDAMKEQIQEEAMRAQAGIPGSGANADPTKPIMDAINMLKSLGINVGAGSAAEPKRDLVDTLVRIAPLVPLITPIIQALLGPRPAPSESLMNTLLTHALKPQGESESMKAITNMVIGSMKQVLELKEAMRPEEKEPFIERVFDKFIGMTPMVMSILKQSKEEQDRNALLNMVKGSKDFQTIKDDPEIQAGVANRMDEYYGFQQSSQIMAVMGLNRPPETLENYKKWASKGYGLDGNPVSDAPRPAPAGEDASDLE